MNAAHLAGLYLVIGGGAAAWVVLRRTGPDRWRDAALLVAVWPLYAPFLIGGVDGIFGGPLLDALRLGRGTCLEALLPDEAEARRLAARVQAVACRAAEIDRVLGRPDFAPGPLARRIDTLRAAGHHAAAEAAERSLRNVERLQALRARCVAELDEVAELVRQLHTQVEVVRLSGLGAADAGAVVGALLDRVSGLDALLEDEVIVGG